MFSKQMQGLYGKALKEAENILELKSYKLTKFKGPSWHRLLLHSKAHQQQIDASFHTFSSIAGPFA